jgi:hypothetical protein
MANKKISGLPDAGALTGAELVELVKGGVNVQSTAQDVADLGGGGGHTIEDEGTPLTQRTKLNFVGASVAVTDDSGDDATVVTISSTGVSDGDKGDVVVSSSGTVWTVETSTESLAGKAELSTQAENNTGTDDERIVTPLKLKNLDRDSSALTDAGTIDITGPKHTLATSSSRTFTISHTGDDMVLTITLSATSATQTFPAAALCVSDGLASGDNTCPLAGVSGDKYVIAIKKVGSAYYVVAKNFGQ